MLCLIIFSITSLEIIKKRDVCYYPHDDHFLFLKLFHLFFTSIPYAFTNKRNSHTETTHLLFLSVIYHIYSHINNVQDRITPKYNFSPECELKHHPILLSFFNYYLFSDFLRQ